MSLLNGDFKLAWKYVEEFTEYTFYGKSQLFRVCLWSLGVRDFGPSWEFSGMETAELLNLVYKNIDYLEF